VAGCCLLFLLLLDDGVEISRSDRLVIYDDEFALSSDDAPRDCASWQ